MFRGPPGAQAQAPERACSQSLPVVICAADEVDPPGTSARDSAFADAKPTKRATWLLWTHEVGWANWLHTSLARSSAATWRTRVAGALQSFAHAPGQPPGGVTPSGGGRLQSAPRFAIAFGVICLLLFASQMAAGGARWLPSSWLDKKSFEQMVRWIEERPLQGRLIFVVVDIVAIVVAFPGAFLAVAAGAMFGVVTGSVLVWVGTTVGQTVAFIVGRYLLRRLVVEWMSQRFPKWQAVDGAISKEGWKLITLLRLSPIIPWNVLNYALAVTGVKLMPYTVSSMVSIIPWCITFCYFGSLAKSLADVFEGQAGPDGPTSVLIVVISGALLIAVVTYTTIIARRAVREALRTESPDAPDIAEELEALIQSSDGDAATDELANQAPDAGGLPLTMERRPSMLAATCE